MNKKKILIVQTAFLGDVILTTPLIKAIKSVFPNSEIDFLVISGNKKILEGNPNLNNIFIFDKKKHKIKSFFENLRKLRKVRYDLAFLPHSSLTSALLIYFSGSKRRIGFNRRAAKHFLTDRVDFRTDCHRIEKNLDLLKVISNQEYDMQTQLFLSKGNLQEADAFFDKINPKKKSIIITPGSFWETKKWLKEYFVELINKLNDFNVILDGAPFEKEYCDDIIGKTQVENIYNICDYNFMTSVAIMQKCDLALCNDSGAMHMANAVQTDVFAFFGPTSTKNSGYFPFRENDFVFEVDLPCRPCGKHGHKECPLGHHDCMKMITPEMVYSKIKDLF